MYAHPLQVSYLLLAEPKTLFQIRFNFDITVGLASSVAIFAIILLLANANEIGKPVLSIISWRKSIVHL
jgi:hypothetical protein